ncbi:MAG TPA: hypothetical protein VH482_04035 [Thermomicrobiales bacterium]
MARTESAGAVPVEQVTAARFEADASVGEMGAEGAVSPPDEGLDTAASHKVVVTTRDESAPEVSARERVSAPVEDAKTTHSPNGAAREIARQFLAGTATAEIYTDLLGRLLLDGRLGLAYHLTVGCERAFPELAPFPPAWAIHALALSGGVRYEGGELAALLRADFARFDGDIADADDPSWQRTANLLLAAAALRPALLAPNTGAGAVLSRIQLKDGFAELAAYIHEIGEYALKGQPLDAQALKTVKDQAGWQGELDGLRREVEEWLVRAPTMRTAFAAASDVWRRWTLPGGFLSAYLRKSILDGTADNVAVIQTELKDLADRDEFDRLVHETDRRVNKRGSGEKIVADALEQLHRNWNKALDFVRRWIALQEVRPDRERGFHESQAELVRVRVLAHHQQVLEELACARTELEQAAEAAPALGLAAIAACERAVQDIAALFDPNSPLAAEEPAARHLIHADLLRTSSLVLDGVWEPQETAEQVLTSVVAIVAADDGSWTTAFRDQSEVRNHQATERIIEYLEAMPAAADGVRIEQLRQSRARALRDCRQALVNDADRAAEQVEGAVLLGLVDDERRSDYVDTIAEVKTAAADAVSFRGEHARLDSIREELRSRQQAATAGVQARLEMDAVRERLAKLPGAEQRILAVLAAGDAPTATEYVDMVLADHGLPEQKSEVDRFRDFFAVRLDDIVRQLADPGGAARGGLDAPRGPAAARIVDDAAPAMSAWTLAKRNGAFRPGDVETILKGVGFGNPRATWRQGASPWFDVITDSIGDRDRCPVYQYGSSALGRYRVLSVKHSPYEDELLSQVGDTGRGAPVIVFYQGVMNAKRRRDLAHSCRQSGRTALVLDDALMRYLATVGERRLATFFACALPFTTLNPYITTASLVPPEVFHGRAAERRSIEDPMGSCFIYGGRQLGKTALLRDVARSFDEPAAGRIAVWLDLKVEGIGFDRSIDDFWRLIALHLKRHGVLRTTLNVPDRLLAAIMGWLEADTSRRILLLLDESDRFLESDGAEGFRRVARIKGLMDQTNRRFKVVFAGLHNVQRTARQENQPLAHYGTPVRIGPLLENGEWREARALIEQSFEALGYRFETPDLVTRILSRTNYYPSLIQLYCSHLLRRVSAPNVTSFDRTATPPYVLTREHVDAAYQDDELRKAIRDRFLWTLDLDPRYRVIAFAIALEWSASVGHAGHGALHGFSTDWIREEALTWWPQGFREATAPHVFRELLDEMVGLGILRQVTPDRYALRSANVVALLGTTREIERELEAGADREAPVGYEPGTFRAAYRNSGDVDRARRSPLTADQESTLRTRAHGVGLVFGCRAAGLDDVEPFLRSAVESSLFEPIDGVTDRSQFARRLRELELGRRDRIGTTVVLVTHATRWTESWVEEAMALVNRFTSQVSFVRVVFLADPEVTWKLLDGALTSPLDRLVEAECVSTELRPWDDAALRHWLEDANFGPSDPTRRKEITQVTGNWPILLDRLYRGVAESRRHWDSSLDEVRALFDDPAEVDRLARAFGLDQPTPRRVLRDLAMIGDDITEDDLIGLVEGEVSPDRVRHTLRWADRLGIAKPVGGACWHVDEVVARVFQHFSP